MSQSQNEPFDKVEDQPDQNMDANISSDAADGGVAEADISDTTTGDNSGGDNQSDQSDQSDQG